MFAARSGGGYGMVKTSNAAKPLSSIYLIPLWLSPVNRPPRSRRGRKAGTRATPPPPNRGGMRPWIAALWDTPLSRPHGAALVLIYPCGKAWNRPPFPSPWMIRIGPRRQGFASPLRALDGEDRSEGRRCSRGGRGGGRGARRGESRMIKDIIIHIPGRRESEPGLGSAGVGSAVERLHELSLQTG